MYEELMGPARLIAFCFCWKYPTRFEAVDEISWLQVFEGDLCKETATVLAQGEIRLRQRREVLPDPLYGFGDLICCKR